MELKNALKKLEESNAFKLWNITFVTHSFRILNMKINAEDGKISYHNLESLMDLVKK